MHGAGGCVTLVAMATRLLLLLGLTAFTSAAGGAPGVDAALQATLRATACAPGEGTGTDAPRGRMVLVPGMTPAHMPVTADTDAQKFFDQGLGQLLGFDYEEALESFREARRIDPACVMCRWGEALALGPYINSGPIDAATIAEARALVGSALKDSAGLGPRDRALLDALWMRYAPGGRQNGVHGDRYADTMIRLAAQFEQDDFVAVHAAEAIMDAQPWDYWQAGGRTPKGRAGDALRLVETVLARSLNDPQAIHLLIHLTEASAAPERAAAPAARLANLAPGAPHMVHMPSHSWYRLGRFEDAIAANKAAIAADEAYARAVGGEPRHYGYFRHHSHFLASAATQIGDREIALAAADALEASIPAGTSARGQGQQVTALQARARFLTPEQFLALPAPAPAMKRLRIAWHGARAEAEARLGNPAAARTELAALRTLRDETAAASNAERAVAALADTVARARIAEAEGQPEEALRQYRAAEAIESGLGYFEPPLWATPVAVLAGEFRMRLGDNAGARADFRRALASRPGHATALAGLGPAPTGR